MATEKAIHFAIFLFLLLGLCSLSAWVSYSYLQDQLILQISSLALSWGTILLILYVSFKKLRWEWWS